MHAAVLAGDEASVAAAQRDRSVLVSHPVELLPVADGAAIRVEEPATILGGQVLSARLQSHFSASGVFDVEALPALKRQVDS